MMPSLFGFSSLRGQDSEFFSHVNEVTLVIGQRFTNDWPMCVCGGGEVLMGGLWPKKCCTKKCFALFECDRDIWATV